MRPTADEYFLRMAQLVSTRATCPRRQVGCVLINKRKHLLATGYNGPPSGALHCIDHPCPGANCPSGTGLDLCEAIHAEQNALLQCRDVYDIVTAYCTTAPCVHCAKLFANTGCNRIVFLDDYPTSGRELWLRGGRRWEQKSLST